MIVQSGGNLKWNSNVKSEQNTLMDTNGNLKFIYPNYLKNITSYSIPAEITNWDYLLPSNITEIKATDKLSNITAAALPSSITSINIDPNNKNLKVITDSNNNKMLIDKNCNLVYYYGNKNKSVTITDKIKFNTNDTPKVINYINGYSLKDLNAEEVEINAKNLGRTMFGWNVFVKTLTIGKDVENVNQMYYANGYDYNLIVNSENTKYYTDKNFLYELNGENYILRRCIKRSKEINLPATVNNGKKVTEIGEDSFYSNQLIESADLTNTEITTIDNNAFNNCSNLKEIKLSNKVTTLQEKCFSSCLNLNSVYMATSEKNNKISGAPWGATKGDRAIKWLSQ